ncbi:MAG: hypothetical protein QF755_00880 [Candidatus Peribacteraceae bacterium]|jgi:hypothetical protein|nr:hypothetical protein [Candidatus Peribacteraceae bacterium]HCI03425.1 hypothetical protein [Candidatus Peribacteria bacterium]|tara:strand:+ start:4120 stop:4761 length:642 start_codon:yes stop_codon:yes gene_type:complete
MSERGIEIPANNPETFIARVEEKLPIANLLEAIQEFGDFFEQLVEASGLMIEHFLIDNETRTQTDVKDEVTQLAKFTGYSDIDTEQLRKCLQLLAHSRCVRESVMWTLGKALSYAESSHSLSAERGSDICLKAKNTLRHFLSQAEVFRTKPINLLANVILEYHSEDTDITREQVAFLLEKMDGKVRHEVLSVLREQGFKPVSPNFNPWEAQDE